MFVVRLTTIVDISNESKTIISSSYYEHCLNGQMVNTLCNKLFFRTRRPGRERAKLTSGNLLHVGTHQGPEVRDLRTDINNNKFAVDIDK